MMNFSVFYGLCDSTNVKILENVHVFGDFVPVLAVLQDLDRQHAKPFDEKDCSVFAFFIFHIDATILCFYYMSFESINLIFIIECCKISMC